MTETEIPRVPCGPSIFLTRRRFVELGVASVGAAWVGLASQSHTLASPSTTHRRPIEIPLEGIKVGEGRLIVYGGAPAIILRTQDSVRALSLVCTHLGCAVQWRAAQQGFYCPCHDGRFDQFGEVIGGPPPVALEELSFTIVNDRIVMDEVG